MKRLDDLIPNERNPRTIAPEALAKLAESIQRDPEFMVLRPIVVDEAGVIIGGNQRFHACREILGMTEVPDGWVKVARGLTSAQRDRFVLVDNGPEGMSGEWDFGVLSELFPMPDLEALGVLRAPEPVDTSAAWTGMPEFHQEDLAPKRTLPIHFASDDDVAAFAKLIGQTITPKTRSLWFPAAEIGRTADKRYVDGGKA